MVYTEAMARWTAATCVDFVMAEESDVDYLNLAGDGWVQTVSITILGFVSCKHYHMN